METSYGIGVKNRYAIFLGDEQEDPLELVSKTVDKAKTEKAADKKSVKALNESTKLSNANQQNIIKEKTQKDSLNSKTSTHCSIDHLFDTIVSLFQNQRLLMDLSLCQNPKTPPPRVCKINFTFERFILI